MTLLKKISTLALCGAVGAAAGAVAGEFLFLKSVRPGGQRSICLLFDVSGSMGEIVEGEAGGITQLEALKRAARDFIGRQNLPEESLGLAVFSSRAKVISELGNDAGAIERSLVSLNAGGGTDIGFGLDVAREALSGQPGERWILLFSDGEPESSSTDETPEQAAVSAAKRARRAGVQIVAIGTGLADADLLARVTGSRRTVIISDPRALEDAFRRSEEVMNRQMLASEAQWASFSDTVAQAGYWACLVAIGAGLGMVIGQNRHLRRRQLSIKEGIVVTCGGLATGLLSGVVGQSVFYVLAEAPEVIAIARIFAWALLGGGAGFGMASFVPNLCRKRATYAGAAGGVVAAFFFLTLVPALGDTLGRLAGAAILGLAIGLAIGLVEAVYRRASLIVHWAENERSTLALGATPILVGCSKEAHILLSEADSPVPVVARITMNDGVIQQQDMQSGRCWVLHDGDTLTFGRLRVEVRAGRAEDAATRRHTAGRLEAMSVR